MPDPPASDDDRPIGSFEEYVEHFKKNVFPQQRETDIMVTLYSGDGADFDVKQATELGAMLLMDKPLILVQLPGAKIPTRLARAADVIVPSDPGDTDRDIQRKVKRALSDYLELLRQA